jgi:hypothetical protein
MSDRILLVLRPQKSALAKESSLGFNQPNRPAKINIKKSEIVFLLAQRALILF